MIVGIGARMSFPSLMMDVISGIASATLMSAMIMSLSTRRLRLIGVVDVLDAVAEELTKRFTIELLRLNGIIVLIAEHGITRTAN